MIELYENSGYLNIPTIMNLPVPFIFVIGGRGIGKTYGTLKTLYEKSMVPYIYLRRTDTEKSIIASSQDFNPLRKVLGDVKQQFVNKSLNKYVDAYYYATDDSVDENPFCYCIGLSVFANMRGFDGNAINYLVYDEFIKESHGRPIKNEGLAFLNCYETINRNRELEGRPPLKAILLSNSENITNPIFSELGLDLIAQKMKKERKECYIDTKSGYAIIYPLKSPISNRKKETALYHLSQKSIRFSKMALENDYVEMNEDCIKSQNLKEYVLQCTIGNVINVYKHKSSNIYYISLHKSGTCKEYFQYDEIGFKKFERQWGILKILYYHDKVYFEDIISKHTIEKIFRI